MRIAATIAAVLASSGVPPLHGSSLDRVTGAAALHEHVMAEFAFGGRWFWGSVDGPEERALRECDGNAGANTHAGSDPICGLSLFTRPFGRDTCGHASLRAGRRAPARAGGTDAAAHPDDYRQWPIWDTQGHPRYWHGHLRRALQAGLKLMVVHAVENEPLCFTASRYVAAEQALRPSAECRRGDSWPGLKAQIDALKAFVRSHSDFLHIALSPSDARAAIAGGKMALVIGVEADYAWGIAEPGDGTPAVDLDRRLDDYHRLGVRTVFLAHHLNTRLAGAALFLPVLGAQQSFANCFDLGRQCTAPDSVATGPPRQVTQSRACFGASPARGYQDLCLGTLVERTLRPHVWDGFAHHPQGGVREESEGRAGGIVEPSAGPIAVRKNAMGLTPDGERIARGMMRRGMLLDVGHLSERAVGRLYEISRDAGGYPLFSSHSLIRGTLRRAASRIGGRTEAAVAGWEFALGDRTLDMIRETGGVVALMTAPDPTVTYAPAGVANDCVRSTRTLAQAMAYVVDRGPAVAWAGDWMGQGRGVAPRRGYSLDRADWCGGRAEEQAAQGARLLPELTRYATAAERDAAYFGTRGLAHWGLIGAFHDDLKAIQVPERVRKPFTHDAAENVLRMWERAEALAGGR